MAVFTQGVYQFGRERTIPENLMSDLTSWAQSQQNLKQINSLFLRNLCLDCFD